MDDDRSGKSLLAWQHEAYPAAHRDRRNLLAHAATVPVFWLGLAAIPHGIVRGPWWYALGGLGMMALAMAIQGRTHGLEQTPPAPFRGPLDVVGRIFGEQLLNFPRYVLSGGFARAWRAASAPRPDR